jgi:hypothetical protein
MYKGSNAEKLHNMCLYDLLCRMQDNADNQHHEPFPCVVGMITGEHPIWRCAEFMESKRTSCNKCIAAYLNERSE